MLVDKIKLIPTKFDGIEQLCTEQVEMPISDVIRNKYKGYTRLSPDIVYTNFHFLSNVANNVLNLRHEIESYDYGSIKFVVDDNFKIDQNYLEHIFSVIESNWDDNLAKWVLSKRILAFNQLAKIAKDSTGEIVKSWEELEKNCKLQELLKIEHIKDRIDIIKMLFLKLLDVQDRFNLISKRILKNNTKDGFFTYLSGESYIDKFGYRKNSSVYTCDFNGRNVRMYPMIKDLMHEYEIAKYKETSKLFDCETLTILTTPEKLESVGGTLDIDYTGTHFKRIRSTSDLVLSGIESKSFTVRFNLTAEEIKLTLAKFGKTRTGLKADLLSKLGELSEEMASKHNDILRNYFNSNMVVQFATKYRVENNKIIDGIDESIANYAMYVYIKNRIHGSALFLRDTKNDLYDATNDFKCHNDCIEIRFLRLNEGIT